MVRKLTIVSEEGDWVLNVDGKYYTDNESLERLVVVAREVGDIHGINEVTIEFGNDR